jgi:hypothetical protein
MKQKIFNVGAVLMILACAGVIALQAQGGRVQAAQTQSAPPAAQPGYQQDQQQQQAPPQQQAPAQQYQQAPAQPQYQQGPPQQYQQQTQCIPAPPQMNQPQYQNGPQVNIGKHHGNLRQAQIFLAESYQAVGQAQQMNEDELGGHADRARQLIVQADVEIRLAANVSNQEGH